MIDAVNLRIAYKDHTKTNYENTEQLPEFGKTALESDQPGAKREKWFRFSLHIGKQGQRVG